MEKRKPGIKIRGIYATALTQFFLKRSFSIVEPSEDLRSRFTPLESPTIYGGDEINRILVPNRKGGKAPSFLTGFTFPESLLPPEIQIKDKLDKQGVIIEGEKEAVEEILKTLASYFPALIISSSERLSLTGLEKYQTYKSDEIFFPSLTKEKLDKIRAEVIPTLKNHHRFKIFAGSLVDELEKQLEAHPDKKKDLEEKMSQFLYNEYQMGKVLEIYHLRPEGELLKLSPGEIQSFECQKSILILRRKFYSGFYDGLDLEIAEGDYALSQFQEKAWFIKHRYYSKNNQLKGEFFNINTPIEFYPDYIFYLDLHLDLIKWPDGKFKIIDEEELNSAHKKGIINDYLFERANDVAKELIEPSGEKLPDGSS